jgi:hypothetical protein
MRQWDLRYCFRQERAMNENSQAETVRIDQERDPPADDGVAGHPSWIMPQDFYREAVQRDDIRRILAALARNQ